MRGVESREGGGKKGGLVCFFFALLMVAGLSFGFYPSPLPPPPPPRLLPPPLLPPRSPFSWAFHATPISRIISFSLLLDAIWNTVSETNWKLINVLFDKTSSKCHSVSVNHAAPKIDPYANLFYQRFTALLKILYAMYHIWIKNTLPGWKFQK